MTQSIEEIKHSTLLASAARAAEFHNIAPLSCVENLILWATDKVDTAVVNIKPLLL
jgi:hypothetical protein